MTHQTDQVINPSKHTWGLTPAEWDELVDYINENQFNKRPVPRMKIALIVYDYGKIYGLYSMYRYLKQAQAKGVHVYEIMKTIGDDLKNRRTEGFIPVTERY